MTQLGPSPQFPLKDNRVLHHRQPVAIVVAQTREQATSAARLVELAYEESQAILGIGNPLGTGRRRPVGTGHRARRCRRRAGVRRGDLRREFTIAAETNNPLGPFATVAHWGATRLTVHDSTPVADAGAETLAPSFGAGGQRTGARRRTWAAASARAAHLAAHVLAAMAARTVTAGQAGADPAADVHLHRPPPADRPAPAARGHPGRSAGRHRPRGHLDGRDRGGQHRADHWSHAPHVRVPEPRDARPAGAAQHSQSRRDARPGQGRGQLRHRVRARRAVLRSWGSTRSSCGCATTPRSSPHPACPGRARRCGSATRLAPSDSAGPTRNPEIRLDARRATS